MWHLPRNYKFVKCHKLQIEFAYMLPHDQKNLLPIRYRRKCTAIINMI